MPFVRPAHLFALATCAAATVLALPALARTCTWTGAVDNLATTAGNWACDAGSGPPAGGDDVMFPAAAAHKDTYSHNYASGLVPIFNTIDFAPGYTVNGPGGLRFTHSLYATGPLTVNTLIDGQHTGTLAIREAASTSDVVYMQGYVRFMSPVAGITVGTSGAANTARLILNGTLPGSPDRVTVYQGGRLSFATSNASEVSVLTVRQGGTLAVSDPPPGVPPAILGNATVTQALDLQSGSTFEYLVHADGFSSGGVIIGAGATANLSGATLKVVLGDPGAPEPVGTEHRILEYPSGTTLGSTFASLPEGATVEASNAPGVFYRITYGAAGTETVQLNRVAAPPRPSEPGAAVPVPTLGSMGLALLALLAGAMGLRARRRG
ncbi:MAG: IPTL-CTERM sorting domain-containing protein [Comamonas sp.]